ncbi:hypothetical protein [uncultured Paraglaciecola sp.]|uniref:hypothetical protein n=1 Tax=uncultured Paraglaciecola sp. TaxID=1765024 RepID=UPI002621DAE5|nr:hypothetical protein [uncultured Paraglaciecola sp.]
MSDWPALLFTQHLASLFLPSHTNPYQSLLAFFPWSGLFQLSGITEQVAVAPVRGSLGGVK